MTFSNVQVCLHSLPALDAVTFEPLHFRYAQLVLGLALLWGAVTVIATAAVLFAIVVPNAGMPAGTAMLACGSMVLLGAFVAWFGHKAASVVRYALREHDVIVQSGVFWRRETVQPIRRIQHIEQHQGPLDRYFGLYTLKLFSAGTGHFTFRIPGLDAQAAARIRQYILSAREAVSAPEPGTGDA